MFFSLVLGAEEWNPVADTLSFLEIAVYLDAFKNENKIQFTLCNNLQSLHEAINKSLLALSFLEINSTFWCQGGPS